MDAWTALAQLATRQHGCVTRRQCIEMGVSSSTLSRTQQRFRWRPLHNGVLAWPGTRYTFEQQAMAALLAVGGEALITGEAALHLLQVRPTQPRTLSLLVPHGRSVVAPAAVEVIHTNVFETVQRHTIDGLTVAVARRALADHARHTGALPLGRLMARACGRRRCTLQALEAELGLRARFPGRKAFRRGLALVKGELTHSATERAARRHLREASIRVHPRPYVVEHRGRVIGEIDVAVPTLLYGAEIDGPHHDVPEQAAADKQRDRELGRLGWHIDRFPVERIDRHPATFVAEVQQALAMRM